MFADVMPLQITKKKILRAARRGPSWIYYYFPSLRATKRYEPPGFYFTTYTRILEQKRAADVG